MLSNDGLRRDYESWLASVDLDDPPPTFTIPDRLELSHFEGRRAEHTNDGPVRFIWFGMAQNRVSLYSALANLERLACNGYDIELTIMDDRPDTTFNATRYFPIYHTRWHLDQEVSVIAAHDIALLPPYPGPWGKVKSNNKWLTAWGCGAPPLDGLDYEYLKGMAEIPSARQGAAASGWGRIKQEYDIRQSAVEWDELLC